MILRRILWGLTTCLFLGAAAIPLAAVALSTETSAQTPTQIDASPRIRLVGNVRPEVTAGNDLGPVEDSFPLDHILLQLKRTPTQQAELDAYVAALTDPASPSYHRWLTAEEFGRRFGVAQSDIHRITAWLALHGVTVNAIYANRQLIDFSATAAQLREAFGTEIHAYDIAGRRHTANATDPTIPVAVAPMVAGIISLHDFRPQPQLVSHPHPQFTSGSGNATTHPVTASDLATVYNLTPLFSEGYTGKGETIAVLEDSDVHSATDWATFRAAFGLTRYTTGALKQIHPAPANGASDCKDPGALTGWDEEPILDAEYASAAAPGAAIEVAACASTAATNGTLIALANLINTTTPPAVISISYGACEAANGVAANAAIDALYEQAAAEGISLFAAAGDAGAAFCDLGAAAALHGIAVNAYASTPYDVAVGGTDFADTYDGTENTYWNKTDSSNGSSARSYIPETPWNDSCANPLLAAWSGYKTAYGSIEFCLTDLLTLQAYQTTLAGSGGHSNCAYGKPQLSLAAGGCKGYAKPIWQSVTGNPKDGLRDLPDVALFAADGLWGHYFLFCDSNLNDEDGATCKTTNVAEWSQGGGTSFAAPILAGIQTLIAQKWGRQGNPNPVYYRLAAAQFTSPALKTACAATEGATSGASCIFHDINQGASTVNCEGILDCYGNILSTSHLADDPAYNATAGWDFATGLGSVNAYNLVMNAAWQSSKLKAK